MIIEGNGNSDDWSLFMKCLSFDWSMAFRQGGKIIGYQYNKT